MPNDNEATRADDPRGLNRLHAVLLATDEDAADELGILCDARRILEGEEHTQVAVAVIDRVIETRRLHAMEALAVHS